MTRDEVIRRLQAAQDLKYRDFHSKLCPGLENIIGVRMPAQHKIAREITKGDFRKFLGSVKHEYYEETLIAGLVIATAKLELDERLKLLAKFVPRIDNWATCDCVTASFKFNPGELAEVWDFITKYQNSVREFELRFMLIMMLDHFLTEEYIDKVLKITDNIKSDDYYVKMAQAWLVAEIFTKFRDKGLDYLQKNDLNAWTQNKAIQKIRESYRVPKDDKALVMSLKKCGAGKFRY